jgi:cytochrome c553
MRFVVLAAILYFASSALGQVLSVDSRIQQCGFCHGEDGNSKTKNLPSLAGQPEFFILNQLFLMREGVRVVETMTPYVRDLKDVEIEALARHFAAQEPKAAEEKPDPELSRRGRELAIGLRCASCHLPNLAGRQQMPRLARQRVDYLIYSMKEFRDNKRSGADTLMSNVVAGLSDEDLTALAHYAASVE